MSSRPNPEAAVLSAIEAARRGLELDPAAHRYSRNGRELLGVTSILEAAGMADWLRMVRPEDLEFARERGHYIHQATELHDQGVLDWDSLDERIRPYVEAYVRWRKQSGFRELAIEQPLAGEGYAGTPDRIGVAEGFAAIVDIKSGAADPAHAVQLAAYALMLQGLLVRRFVLRLGDDGRFRAKELPLDELGADAQVFCGALQVAQWKRRWRK